MKKVVLILLSIFVVTSCNATKIVDIKSPCVSNKDGPCGPRKPVNDWWLKSNV